METTHGNKMCVQKSWAFGPKFSELWQHSSSATTLLYPNSCMPNLIWSCIDVQIYLFTRFTLILRYVSLNYCRQEGPMGESRYTDKLRKSIYDLKQQVLLHETDVQKTHQVKSNWFVMRSRPHPSSMMRTLGCTTCTVTSRQSSRRQVQSTQILSRKSAIESL